MDEFKKSYKVEESTLYSQLKKRIEEDEEGKIKREPKKVEVSYKIIDGIFSLCDGVLTEEVKKKILEMDEKNMPGIQYIVCCMFKKYIRTGNVSQEYFNECYKSLEEGKRKFELEKIDQKLSIDPSSWETR